MTRATFAIMHGDFPRAFRMNPVGVILMPAAMFGLGLETIGWVRDKPLPWRFHIGAKGSWIIAWIMIAFWILRNIPHWPFTLLAPH